MELSPLDPPPLGADLSRTFSAAPRTRSHGGAMDLVKKPQWYQRQQAGGAPEPGSPFSCRSSAPYLAPPRCRNLEQHLYRRVQGRRWLQGRYDAASSPLPESSDSDSDVLFLVSSAEEEALLCGSFLQGRPAAPLEPLEPLEPAPRRYGPAPPLSSPSPDSSYSEESSDSSLDVLLHRARPVVLLSELGAVCQNRARSQVSSEDSDATEASLVRGTPSRAARSRFGDAAPQGDGDEAPPAQVRRSGRTRRSVWETPPRTSRLRLQRRAKNEAAGIYYESCQSDDAMDAASGRSDADDRKSPLTASEGSKPGTGPDRQLTNQTEGERRRGQHRRLGAAPERRRKQKTATARMRRRKKGRSRAGPRPGPSASEPEVQRRCAGAKEEKKSKAGAFCPFVHVDERTCVIVNFQEDEDGARSGRVPGRPAPGPGPAFVPNTSCLRPCRRSSEGGCPPAPLCCLCAQTANAMGLGDLHGPYTAASSSPKGDCAAAAELWLHEDCGIWAAGVFLVRGRLYGLEEAARLAQQTVSQLWGGAPGRSRTLYLCLPLSGLLRVSTGWCDYGMFPEILSQKFSLQMRHSVR